MDLVAKAQICKHEAFFGKAIVNSGLQEGVYVLSRSKYSHLVGMRVSSAVGTVHTSHGSLLK